MKFFSFWRSLATYRVRIAMNLKGLKPDEVIDVNLMKGQQREEAFRKVNPMMAIPALVDGDGPALFESLAIIEYLDETHPNPPLLPKDPQGPRAGARACADRRLRLASADRCRACANISTHEFKLDEATRRQMGAALASRGADRARDQPRRTRRPASYAHGDQHHLADICLASQAAGASFFKVDLAPFPTFKRIVDACMQNEAFARAHPLKQPGAPASV